MDDIIDVNSVNLDMDFDDAKKLLKRLWQEIRVPPAEQHKFADMHFVKRDTVNEACILSQINKVLFCRNTLVDILNAIQARNILILKLKFVRSVKSDKHIKRVADQLVQCTKQLLSKISDWETEYSRWFNGGTFVYNKVNVVDALKSALSDSPEKFEASL